MAKSTRSGSLAKTAIKDLAAFIREHGDAPLEEHDEIQLFVLDLLAGRECAALQVTIPAFPSASHTPALKLNYSRESIYKYPGATSGDLQIPEGEKECYRICLSPTEDWMVWFRAIEHVATTPAKVMRVRTRDNRRADIQRLDQVVIRLLREAAEHAAETWDWYGEPEVLTRRDQKLVGDEIGLSESQTSRCFKDKEAEQLRAHWEVLLDRDRILALAESRRSKRNKR